MDKRSLRTPSVVEHKVKLNPGSTKYEASRGARADNYSCAIGQSEVLHGRFRGDAGEGMMISMSLGGAKARWGIGSRSLRWGGALEGFGGCDLLGGLRRRSSGPTQPSDPSLGPLALSDAAFGRVIHYIFDPRCLTVGCLCNTPVAACCCRALCGSKCCT